MDRPPKPRLRLAQFVTQLAIAALILATLAFWLRTPADPLYQGKKLSARLYDTKQIKAAPALPALFPFNPLMIPPAAPSQNRLDADEAVRALGPLAAPLMIEWLQSRWTIREKLRQLASAPSSRFAWLLKWDWIVNDPHPLAYDALMRLIPEHGARAIPILCKQVLAEDPSFSAQAAALFVQIMNALPSEDARRIAKQQGDFIELVTRAPPARLNRPAVRVLSALIDHDAPYDCERIVRRLWPYRLERFNDVRYAIAQLDNDGFYRNLIYLESGTGAERDIAALFFRDTPFAPERIVPLLTSNLDDSASISLLQDASGALAVYGTNATSALPRLTNLLTHSKLAVTQAASNAIARITAP